VAFALPLLLALPWVGAVVFLAFVAKPPRDLPERPARAGRRPLVSIIVPARDEAVNIETCVRSLTATEYEAFEVIVVDDRSSDGTAEIVRGLDRGNARRIIVVAGRELPEGWLGKPWACKQGADVAEGELLLFTDADTRHGQDLLARAVAGLDEELADLFTVIGRQLLESFWERVVQPQIFLMMLVRFPRIERTVQRGHWREAIANGQYMLFRRSAYDAVGGHESVKDEVAEDLALAQRVRRAGLPLRVRGAESELATRMYRSLGHLVEGWSKNLFMGGLQTMPPAVRGVVVPATLAAGVVLWIVPPVVLASALVGAGGTGLLVWSGAATALSLAIWTSFVRRMGIPAAYGLLYPLGAAVGAFILARSWVRGRNVEWKGRRYVLPPASSRP